MMNMDDLRKQADLPLWHDGEHVQYEYRYPVPLSPWRAGRWTLRSWKHVAEHHVADTQLAPYVLTENMPSDELYEMDGFWCATSPQSHIGPFLNAIDFLIPDGTPVLAAQEGEIVQIIQQHTAWGNGEQYRDTLNYMTLVHASGELTQYCHLAQDSVSVLGLRIGSGVKQGQRIATVGKTGWTDRDHLHFLVFRDDKKNPINPFGFKSLVPRFRR
jgi:murein DD-endopeptidase MepM/ murein hydrolase activator NlpD